MDTLFNINQAAFILKVHHLTVRRYIKERKLKAIRIVGNVRIKETDLQEFQKEFTPKEQTTSPSPFRKQPVIKVFTSEDPFLRLKGRGASLHLSS